MTASQRNYLGFDLGASSGRAVLGTIDSNRLALTEISRFPNAPCRLGSRLHWNLLGLWSHMLDALRRCAQQGNGKLSGIGADTWGVDFGLLGPDGNLLGNPLCYRDDLTVGIEPVIRAAIDDEELYRLTGWPVARVSTLSQLAALARSPGAGTLRSAETLLMMADLLRHFFCGDKAVELTAGSSGQMIDPRTGRWCKRLHTAFGLPSKIFPAIVPPATVAGKLDAVLAAEAGLNRAPVVAIAGHDTASAAAAVPCAEPDCAFISCGTWSVIGAIQDAPNTSREALAAGFVNEFGLGATLFVKNLSGLYYFESLHRSLNRDQQRTSYAALVRDAARAEPFQFQLDLNALQLYAADGTEAAIGQYLRKTGQRKPADTTAMVRAIFEALAWSYRTAIAQLETLTGRDVRRICLVGGGSRNRLLCQMAADATGLEVIAGPAEATVIGNLASQALATGHLKSMADIRALVRNSFDLRTYRPKRTALWDENCRRYGQVVERGGRQG